MKKLTLLGFVSSLLLMITVSSSAHYVTPTKPGPEPHYAGLYIEVNTGYGFRNWRYFTGSPYHESNIPAGFSLVSSNPLGGGFIVGGDMGYQANEYISAEWGWTYLPYVTGTFLNLVTRDTYNRSILGWMAYAAAKGTILVYGNLFFYLKAGVSYFNQRTGISHGDAVAPVNLPTDPLSSVYWGPIYGAGLQYYFNRNLSINLQYMGIPRHEPKNGNSYPVPPGYLLMLGVGYKLLT